MSTVAGNAVIALPTIGNGIKTTWVLLQHSLAAGAYARLGAVGDTMAAVGEGILVSKNVTEVILFTGGHTHLHCFDTGNNLLTVTPLSQRPG